MRLNQWPTGSSNNMFGYDENWGIVSAMHVTTEAYYFKLLFNI